MNDLRHSSPEKKKLDATFGVLLLAVILLAGCVTPRTRLDNAARLMERPDFPAAKEAAPAWAEDALLTVNRLEYELERR